MLKRFIILMFLLSVLPLVPLSLPHGVGAESTLVILDHYYYEDVVGYANVIGEVQNQGSTTTSLMQFTVTFYDVSDTEVASAYAYTTVDVLLPGEISPFLVSSYPLANLSVEYYVIAGTYYDTEEVPYREFEITGVSEYTSAGWLSVSGYVENTGLLNASYVNVVASFYDETDTLLTFDVDYIDPDILQPEQRASFEVSTFPDEVMPASYALLVQCMETRLASTIECLMEPTVLEDALVVNGILQPAQEQVSVNLTYTMPNGSNLHHDVLTESGGAFFDIIEDPEPGEWQVIAWWPGDATYAGATSEPAIVTLSIWATAITCSTTATNVSIDTLIRVEGQLTPDHAAPASVTLEYTTDTLWQPLATVTTHANGSYSYLWTPTSSGSYQIRASYAGTARYAPCLSPSLNLTLAKLDTTLSCTAPTTVDAGKPVTITGILMPAVADITVTLTYQPPSGAAITRTVTTDVAGEYRDTYTPSATGEWRVTASWDGDSTHAEAASAAQTFTVQQSECLIATATFGSELTPQVQFLRRFRDARVLGTFAGRQFLAVFNSFYYSFSPHVADTIRVSPGVGTVMKGVVYPLIGVLQVSEATYSLFSSSPELAIILAGGLASVLLAAIYLVPGVLLLSHWTRCMPSTHVRDALGLLWLTSVAGLGIAEFTHTSWLMMTATGTFVLATMGVTLVLMLRRAPHLLRTLRHTAARMLFSS